MFISENLQKWSQILTEELGVKDPKKLSWMSQYAQNHEVYESVQSNGNVSGGIYATPLNTLGMGNPMMPQANNFAQGTGIGDTGADFHNPLYQKGSGDIPMSTLNIALEIAAMTIGLELVPTIPSPGPWAMLSYLDFPYAGGKLGNLNETALDGKGEGTENKPIYIKFYVAGVDKTKVKKGDVVTVGDFTGEFIGFSRIDNSVIAKVKSVAKKGEEDQSIADAFAAATTVEVGENTITLESAGAVRADLVSGAADHVQEFSNFHGSEDPMTRAQNETGVGNTIGARMFTKLVQMGSYEVTGNVTRQQLQDMPLYGIDVVGKVMEAMQNEISQAINNRILDRLFKLGVTNAKLQKEYQGVDLNLYFGATPNASKDLSAFPGAAKFVDIHNKPAYEGWGAVKNATQNTSAENTYTHQRRIMSRVLAAANLVANVSRFGRANWVVTNTQILSALQDCAGFVVAPMANTLTQDGSSSLYFAGSIAGLNVYVDPYMTWDDTRVCVGRKGADNDPGVKFMPYILCDTCQIVAEGTMAPKMLCNSRYALVDAGFHPHLNYFTFMVDADGAYLL